MILNFNKRGIILLSHYRSGGTQLLNVLSTVLEDIGIEHTNLGEIEVTADNLEYPDIINKRYFNKEDEKYSIHLLNSPLAINQLYYSGQFDELHANYEIIYLEREDKTNCLLSLALWERFIGTGLFSDADTWTPDNMLNFHTSLIQDPISYQEVSLGMSDELYNKQSEIRVLNDKLQTFSNQICLLQNISRKLQLTTIKYEEYEHAPDILYKKYFPYVSETCKLAIQNTSKHKIPYLTNNYIEYYDNKTAKALKIWGIHRL